MRLRDIINEASLMLGIPQTDKANRQILFRCANLVLSNVASNINECIEEQSFDVKDGKIKFSDFSKTFLKIKQISYPYELFTNYIAVKNGRVNVKYACVPEFKNPSSSITQFKGVISPGALLYGMLSEYSAISGLKNEAKLFEDRFQRHLLAMNRTGKMKRMPA